MISLLIKNIRASLFLKNTLILFIGTTIVNIFNYVFNLVIGRLLTVAEYGELIALESIFMIVGVMSGTLVTAVTRQVSVYRARLDMQGLKIFKNYCEKLFLIFGIAIFIISIFFVRFIADYLKTPLTALIIIDASFIFAFVTALYQSIFQGLQKFMLMSILGFIGVIMKVILGIGFVILGFSTSGAVVGYVAPFIFGAIIMYFFLRYIDKIKIDKNSPKIKITKDHFIYLGKFFVATLCLTLLYNTDLLMVKHYFSGEDGGLYSSLAMLARIIFFSTGIITMVLLPMSTERFERHEKHLNLFLFSFGLVAVVSTISSALYFLFPEFIISLLFGTKYLNGAGLLGIMSLMMAAYSLLNVLIFYLMSIKRFSFVFWLVAATILQAVLIWRFHSSLFQVIMISLGIICGVLILSSLNLLLGNKKGN
ncbi:MAG: oligosaccharide flippase family protein [Patescibacteria group bacterium]